MPLTDGERQVAPTIQGIRRDHVARYKWAAAMNWATVVDVGCGVGYGARLLADAGSDVFALDQDAEAIEYAEQHYGRSDGLHFSRADVDAGICETFSRDVAIAFEVVEHLADPRPMLRGLRNSCRALLASVPNEKVFPFKGYAFHHRHYTRDEFEALLNECGWFVAEWWGQLGPESDVERDVEGRTLIARCYPRQSQIVPPAAPQRAVLARTAPKRVAIVALGGTAEWYVDNVKRFGNRRAFADETWAVNAMGDVIACDLVFHMDDVRIQEIRAAANPKSNIATMLQWLKTTKTPVMTSRAHPDYPALVEFPFEDVANHLNEVYFNNTVAYAVAYALFLGVGEIMLFGCDYIYPNAQKGEMGRACVEYWLGRATERGVKITLPALTPLCDSYRAQSNDDVYAYGYDTLKVSCDKRDDGSMKFTMTPREKLPTAEQIESAYDHGRAPHEQHGRIAAE